MNNEEAILARLVDLKERVGRLDQRQADTQNVVGDIRVAVAGLKVKAGVWGAIAGLIPSAITAIYFIAKAVK